MAVGVLQDAVALVVQVLLIGRYAQIGEGGHEALSEETAVPDFLDRLPCSLYDIHRSSENCTKEPFFRTDGPKASGSK
jgi:hypothetical protein